MQCMLRQHLGLKAYLIFSEVPVELVHFVEGHRIKELFVEWNREVVPANIQ